MSQPVAFVTGCSSGIGRALADAFQRAGYRVWASARKEDDVRALAEAGFQAVQLDVNDAAALARLAEELEVETAGLDVLVNNAGILRDGLTIKVKDGQLSKMSLAQWQSVIDVNLTGVFLCTREVAAKMIELKNEGAIVNISSISRAGNMGQANYSAAKAGVAADTVVWAKELARYGIRVAGVAPGFIETEMTAGMKPEALEKMTAGIPLKRMGKPVEIAHSVAYIFENDYYTGRVLELDGGLRL